MAKVKKSLLGTQFIEAVPKRLFLTFAINSYLLKSHGFFHDPHEYEGHTKSHNQPQ